MSIMYSKPILALHFNDEVENNVNQWNLRQILNYSTEIKRFILTVQRTVTRREHLYHSKIKETKMDFGILILP